MAGGFGAMQDTRISAVTASATRTIRIDIQLLRALAILLVLAHHARIPGVPGGFLGVDIFYVISGYLMTELIARELDERRFAFRAFYARRVRRLLPAANATLIVTAIAAPFLLDAAEYRDFVAQLTGSFGFAANVVLWRQSDYFASGAQLKPLLHMWSLSIEEQYYLLLPLLLCVSPRRWRLPIGIAVMLISAGLCLFLLPRNASAAFYLLPTRAWELGLGSLVALALRGGWIIARPMLLMRLAAVLALVAVPLQVDEAGHPGLPALLVCLATAILIMPGGDVAPRRALDPFVAIGDRSYSLYLVHWPIYAYANNIFIDAVPLELSFALLAVVLLWMELQYRLVEQPFRHMRVDRRSVTLFVGIAIVVCGVTWAVSRQRLADPVIAARVPNAGLAPACASNGAMPPPQCRTSATPRTLLWGDSVAMALAPGLAISTSGGLAQMTMPVCGPFIGIAPVNRGARPLAWARRCIAFNDTVLAQLKASPAIDTVILSSVMAQYVPGLEPYELALRTGGETRVLPQHGEHVVAAMRDTVVALHALGKRVIFVAPTPNPGFDMARCHAREAAGLPVVRPVGGCAFTVASYHSARASTLALLARAEGAGVPMVFLDEILCPGGTCAPTRGDVMLYRDHAHLSVQGSRLIGREAQLGEMLRRAAR